MEDTGCVAFLQWALPQLRMRWPGFRKVRKLVCKRIARRLESLALPDLATYRVYLAACPEEWGKLDHLCRITISRFCRDRAVFAYLAEEALPPIAETTIAQVEINLRAWSIGCAGGEEPYTLAILWRQALVSRFPGLELTVLATDTDEEQLDRAREACYGSRSLKEMPPAWREAAFEERAGRFCLRPEFRECVAFHRQDIRREIPEGTFQLILCRNLVFTYFDETLQRSIAGAIAGRLDPGGLLVLGKHEDLPSGTTQFAEVSRPYRLYRRTQGA